MTRGRFAVILGDCVLVSYEANGDMYFDGGYGYDAMDALSGVHSAEDFLPMLRRFNEEHHKYRDMGMEDWFCRRALPPKGIPTDEDSIYRWTDYVFFKNISENTVSIIGRHQEELALPPGCMCVTEFSEFGSDSIPEKYRGKAYDPKTDGVQGSVDVGIKKDKKQKEDQPIEADKQFKHKGYRRLFIIRKDLQMSPGKLAAQVAHCAEAYWLEMIRNWSGNTNDLLANSVNISGDMDWDILENYVNGAITKTICEARNKNHLMKAKDIALDLGLHEGRDFGLIRDSCLTELEPEDEDGRTTTGIWFRPLPDEVAHQISRKYQLYA